METGPRLNVTSNRLVKPGIDPAIPGLQDKSFIQFTTAAYGIIERPRGGVCAPLLPKNNAPFSLNP